MGWLPKYWQGISSSAPNIVRHANDDALFLSVIFMPYFAAKLLGWVVVTLPYALIAILFEVRCYFQDGATVAAHSVTLMSVPYFSVRLKKDWEGEPRDPGQKLKLDVPCPVGKTALQAFLYYIYGDRRPLYRIHPTRAAKLQVRSKI